MYLQPYIAIVPTYEGVDHDHDTIDERDVF